jgi:hypothetical protein
MKKKQNFKVLLFLLLGIIIVSCQYEDDKIQENQAHDHTHAKVTEMKYNDLFKTNNFNKAVKKIPKYKVRKTDAFGRSVIEDTFGFTIYDAPVKITETDNIISYSILIKSDTIVNGVYFENLVISLDKETLLTDIAKIKYNLSSDIIPTNDESFSFSSVNDIKYLVDDNIDISNKEAINGGPCDPVTYLLCNWGQENYVPIHPAGASCNNTFTVTINPCTGIVTTSGGNNTSTTGTTGTNSTTDTGNNSSSGDSGSTGLGFSYGYDFTTFNNNGTPNTGLGQTYGTGGNVTTSTDLGNPIIINVVPPCPTCPELEEEDTDDCNQIKKISDNTNIKSKLKFLKGKTNEAHETAFMFYRNPATNTMGGVYSEGTNSNNGETSIQYNSTSVGTAHVHQWGIFPMFSPGDLWAVSVFANNYVPPASGQPAFELGDLPFNIMICESQTPTDLADSPHGYAYMVIPNDIQAFKAHLATLQNKTKRKKLNEAMEYLYSVPTSNYSTTYNWNTRNQKDLAKVFLQFINNTSNNPSNTNFDVSLYRIKFDANKNVVGKWEQLSLPNTTNNTNTNADLIITPCNN